MLDQRFCFTSLFLAAIASPVIAQQDAYLKASNTNAGDRFGWSVDIDGDTAVIGAPFERSDANVVDGDQSNNELLDAGAAYVFVRSGSSWIQQGYLKPSDPKLTARFGSSVAVSGDVIAVGSPRADDPGLSESGVVYVFRRNGNTWSEEARLSTQFADTQDFFGRELALDGDTLVVGAPLEDSRASGIGGNQADNDLTNSGAVFVYLNTGTQWTEQAFLKARRPDAFDVFGSSVAVSGDSIVVGAPRESSAATGVNGNEGDNSRNHSGAAYVFVRNAGVWTQEAFLKASNAGFGEEFGGAVSISENTIVVGTWVESSSATGVNGDQLDNSAGQAGAAYVFVRSGTDWSQQAYLKATNTDSLDHFGFAVSVSGDRIVVGAPEESGAGVGLNCNPLDNSASRSGAAYSYRRTGAVWEPESLIKASNTNPEDRFGFAVAVSDDSVLVGARFEDSQATGIDGNDQGNLASNAGAAYVFDFSNPPILPVSHCSGNGGVQVGCTDCPCGNNAPAGQFGGCLNSALTSARLEASCSPSVSLPPSSDADLRFALTAAPPQSFCVLFSGAALAPNNPINPCFGLNSGVQASESDGLRCAVQSTRRHAGRSADLSGSVGVTNNPWGGEAGPTAGIANAGGSFAAGETRFFQVVYRDDPNSSCMTGLNSSQAIEITFTP